MTDSGWSPVAFVVEQVGDIERATTAAALAARMWRLDAPRLLRVSMNATFACGDVVLRVGRPTAPGEVLIDWLRVLHQRGVPAPRPARPSPVEFDGLTVVALERLAPCGPVDWVAVGHAVRAVQTIDPADATAIGYPVPWCGSFPWWDVQRVLAEVDDLLDEAARDAVADAASHAQGWRDAVRPTATGAAVLCHGDVHPGNVVQTATGPVLLDWDLLCSGPAAWDHAAMLCWETRWADAATPPGSYAAFAAGAGWSGVDDPLCRLLADMRLLAATLLRVKAGRDDPAAAAEAQRRLRWWLGDADAPRWIPA